MRKLLELQTTGGGKPDGGPVESRGGHQRRGTGRRFARRGAHPEPPLRRSDGAYRPDSTAPLRCADTWGPGAASWRARVGAAAAATYARVWRVLVGGGRSLAVAAVT